MTTLNPKAPGDILAYDLDFATQLDCDTIATVLATVTTGSVDIEKQTSTPQALRLLIGGGVDDENAEISVAITTRDGQSFTEVFSLAVRAAAQIVATTTTKRDVIEMMFEECGLAGYEFDASPEEQFSALRQLDAMMAEWQGPGKNVAIGYNAPALLGKGDLDDEVGIPDWTIQAVAISLALRFCPKMGKTMSAESKAALASGMASIGAAYALRPEMALGRRTPRGAGFKGSAWWPFNSGRRC